MKTPKNAPASSLPVSKKAYNGFTDRIRQVYVSDASRSALMIDVLDRYLDGDKVAPDTLDEHMRMAFEFLRHDVDLAIERSRRARERARARRAHHTAEAAHAPSPDLMRPDTDNFASHAADKQMDDATFEKKLDECLKKYFTIVDDEPVEDDEEEEEPFDRPLTRRERRARERASRGKSRIKPLCARVG